MIGAIAGDIIGSFFEHSRMKFYDFELFYNRSKFTDDTVMTLAVAKWLMEGEEKTKANLIANMVDLGRKYPRAGYGHQFKIWLGSNDPQPYNSWGNGAAMRVSPVGLYAHSLDEAIELAKTTAEVSHNHPEGVKGAQAVAAAIWMARIGSTKAVIRENLQMMFGYDLSRTIEDIRPDYQWTSKSQDSVPEAIIAFLNARDFEDAVRLAVSLGGDADTQGAIAGSIAACAYPIPEWIAFECEKRMPSDLLGILHDFEALISEKTM